MSGAQTANPAERVVTDGALHMWATSFLQDLCSALRAVVHLQLLAKLPTFVLYLLISGAAESRVSWLFALNTRIAAALRTKTRVFDSIIRAQDRQAFRR